MNVTKIRNKLLSTYFPTEYYSDSSINNHRFNKLIISMPKHIKNKNPPILMYPRNMFPMYLDVAIID